MIGMKLEPPLKDRDCGLPLAQEPEGVSQALVGDVLLWEGFDIFSEQPHRDFVLLVAMLAPAERPLADWAFSRHLDYADATRLGSICALARHEAN